MTAAGNRLAWPLSLGLAAAGMLAAHGVAYRIAEPHAERREHLLEESGHGYWDVELLGSLCVALILVGFIGRVLAGSARGGAPPLALFALAPPLGFAVQEHAERMIHSETLVSAALEPAFLVGLALQLPFALVALLAARALLAAAGALAWRTCLPRPLLARETGLAVPTTRNLSPRPTLVGARGQRAPPLRSIGSRWSAARSRGAWPGKEERKIRQTETTLRSRLVIAVALAAVVAGVLAPGALAHSVLLGTQPENDSVVQESPSEVSLRFNEPVEMSLGGIRVYDGQGNRVDAEQVTPSRGPEVAVGIEGELERGTYTVAWRAISADSDPISGAFVFHVGERGVQPAGISVDSLTGTTTTVEVFFTAGRFFDFALLLLAVGGSAVLIVALPSATWPVRRRLYGILAGLSVALAFVALLNVFFQGAAAGGLALLDAFRWNVFTTVIDTRYGEMMLVQAALAVTLAFTAMALRLSEDRDKRALSALTLVLGFGMSLTPSLSGHASTAGKLAMSSDVAHVIAAALWTGGLGFLVLGLVLAGVDRWPLATRAVPRFSNMAVVSVAALLIAGVINGYLQVRTWSALWETEYGLLLLAKVALVIPLLALGAYNNRYAVPRLKAGLASVLERRRFLTAAGVELAIMVAVVAVTAVLVNAEPARTEAMMGDMAMEDAAMPAQDGAHEPFEAEVDLGGTMAHIRVEPAMPGENTIHLEFEPSDAEEFTEVTVSASLPSEEIGPLPFPAEPVQGEPGTYVAENASLSIPGEWELRIEALVGEFDLLTETVMVPIGEE